MYVYVCMCVYFYMYAYMYIFMYVCICMYIWIYYVCICMYVYMCVRTYVCMFCAYVGLGNRPFSIYCTKKCHLLCQVWHCTLIHSIKLCELHHCTHTHTHTREHTTEFSHSILACTGNRVSRVSFCDVQTVEFELLTHIPHFRLFQWHHKMRFNTWWHCFRVTYLHPQFLLTLF